MIVKEGRPLFRKDEAALNQLATGEIFSATRAEEFGLIDKIIDRKFFNKFSYTLIV